MTGRRVEADGTVRVPPELDQLTTVRGQDHAELGLGRYATDLLAGYHEPEELGGQTLRQVPESSTVANRGHGDEGVDTP